VRLCAEGCGMVRTILVADDDPLIRKTLCEFFESEEGYEVCAEARNGREAIDLALKHRPHLIILDLSMPVMNGVDASRELKRIMPTVPIILFTLYADIENEILAADLLVDNVVSKGDVRNLMGNMRSLIPV
jgi:DNA-binding NarL/FixJ family response regulator